MASCPRDVAIQRSQPSLTTEDLALAQLSILPRYNTLVVQHLEISGHANAHIGDHISTSNYLSQQQTVVQSFSAPGDTLVQSAWRNTFTAAFAGVLSALWVDRLTHAAAKYASQCFRCTLTGCYRTCTSKETLDDVLRAYTFALLEGLAPGALTGAQCLLYFAIWAIFILRVVQWFDDFELGGEQGIKSWISVGYGDPNALD